MSGLIDEGGQDEDVLKTSVCELCSHGHSNIYDHYDHNDGLE